MTVNTRNIFSKRERGTSHRASEGLFGRCFVKAEANRRRLLSESAS